MVYSKDIFIQSKMILSPPGKENEEKAEAIKPIDQLKKIYHQAFDRLNAVDQQTLKYAHWKDTSYRWETGFFRYLELHDTKVLMDHWGLKKMIQEELKKQFEDTKDEGLKNILNTLRQKMDKIYWDNPSVEKPSAKKERKEGESGIYSWENIKFTLRNIRRQIFELVGAKDPWWDYSKQQRGMAELSKEMPSQEGGKENESPAERTGERSPKPEEPVATGGSEAPAKPEPLTSEPQIPSQSMEKPPVPSERGRSASGTETQNKAA
jgi:hypothetical protein